MGQDIQVLTEQGGSLIRGAKGRVSRSPASLEELSRKGGWEGEMIARGLRNMRCTTV